MKGDNEILKGLRLAGRGSVSPLLRSKSESVWVELPGA